MAVTLDGECRVSTMREGEPCLSGTLRIWNQIGRSTGAQAISLRVLEFGPGLSPGLRNPESDEVLYMLENLDGSANSTCTVLIDGWPHEVAPQSGIYLQPGRTLAVNNHQSQALLFVSAQCPEPLSQASFDNPVIKPLHESATAEAVPIVRLADRKTVPTADRWYRVLVDERLGSQQVTQFVGSIPPGRAPDHFHNYEEVLFILRGTGRMWAGNSSALIAAGSCIYLPKGQVHCVENTGSDELRLLGVFYPAGSPAVRYEVPTI
jgi:mannose-6-phosphate isomerase-like protein (cupin superfamily)